MNTFSVNPVGIKSTACTWLLVAPCIGDEVVWTVSTMAGTVASVGHFSFLWQVDTDQSLLEKSKKAAFLQRTTRSRILELGAVAFTVSRL